MQRAPGMVAARGDNYTGTSWRVMQLRLMCKSKIHRATVTGADLNYVGSIVMDEDLMRRIDIISGERVSA